jgi:DNA polymerase-3 subunit epsilon
VSRERLVDTLMLARRKYPGGSNRLDDLCLRYRIDNSRRTKHGALLDAELLSEVYVELIGARQAHLSLVEATSGGGETRISMMTVRIRPQPLAPRIDAVERAAHRAFVATLGAAAVWRSYIAVEEIEGRPGA